jgi:hypothetical protein
MMGSCIGSMVLIQYIYLGIGMNVKTIPSRITYFLEVVAIGQLIRRLL